MVRVKGRDWYLFIVGADGDWSHEELDYDSSAVAGAGPRTRRWRWHKDWA